MNATHAMTIINPRKYSHLRYFYVPDFKNAQVNNATCFKTREFNSHGYERHIGRHFVVQKLHFIA